jgi:hypothetical protein
MNSIDRHSLANTFAVLMFLLLVYGLAGDMDCGSERRMEPARQPASLQRTCEMTAGNAATVDIEHGDHTGSAPEVPCTASDS